MSKTLPVSVRLAPELNKQVTDIAHALDRPKSWVIEQAIKDFVSVQAWSRIASCSNFCSDFLTECRHQPVLKTLAKQVRHLDKESSAVAAEAWLQGA